MTADPAERPVILCVLIQTQAPFRTAVVDLLEIDHWLSLGYLFVCRDPFTLDHWRAWRRAHPEAA